MLSSLRTHYSAKFEKDILTTATAICIHVLKSTVSNHVPGSKPFLTSSPMEVQNIVKIFKQVNQPLRKPAR